MLLLIISINSTGQNLVPDPSIEDYDPLANMNFLAQPNEWWEAFPSCDYHHVTHNGSNLTNLEDCPLGEGNLQCGEAYEGDGVIGIAGVTREWAATQLTEPLIVDECYLVSFWAQNKTDNPLFFAATDAWGVFFNSTDVPVFDPLTLDYDLVTSQYVKMDEMLDSNDWRYVEMIYTPNFAYDYIYVGYMGNETDATEIGSGFYIWFDMVSVFPIDSVEINAMDDFELCEDSVAYLSAESNHIYKWSWNNGANTSTDSILTVSPSVTTTYYAYAGDIDQCAKMDSVTVTIIDCSCMIPIDIAYTVEDNTNCPLSEAGNGSIIVSASNGIEPYFYQWNDPLMQQNDTAVGLVGGDYICTITDSDDCTASVMVTVNEGNIPDFIFNVTNESCPGSMDGSINLYIQNGVPPYTYLWSNDSTTQNISGLSAGQYSVTITDNTNCPFSDFVYVDFDPFAIYDYPIICEGSPVQDLNYMGAINGIWSGPGIIDSVLGLFDPAVSGIGNFEVQFLSNIDCTDNFSMPIIVDALPNVNFSSIVSSGCQPLVVPFTVENAGPDASYLWSFGDGNVSTEPGNIEFTYINPGLFDVSLSITDSSGCSNSITYEDYINVFEKPEADFNFTPEVLDDVQSTAQFFSTSSDAATSWYWTFGDGATSISENPIHDYNGPGYYSIFLYAKSDNGCSDTATNYIRYREVIFMYIPTAFTPNSDGRNDVFQVESQGEINLFSMKIFDRWGELVFTTTNINEPWVGNFQGGEYYLNTEVFTYVIEYEAWGPALDEPIGEKFVGSVMLLK